MKKRYPHRQAVILFLAALALILLTLFLGTDLSLGDNGDFFRTIDLCSMKLDAQRNGLIDLEDRGLLRNILTVLIDHEGLDSYPTSHILPVRLSVITNLIANALLGADVTTYRLSHLAVIYSLLYAAAIAFALTGIRFRNGVSKWLFSGAALAVLCDVGYVSYFASFYGEALQHALLIFGIGFLIRAGYRLPHLSEALGGFLVLILFGISKPFNIPAAMVLCIVYLVLILARCASPQCSRRNAALCLAAVCLLAFFLIIIPNWMANQTNYNAVFFGILRETDEPTSREYLEELGLDPDMAELRNSHFYVSDIFAYASDHDIYSPGKLGYLDLALFYLKHPLFTFSKFPVIMAYSGSIRNTYFLDSNLALEPGRLNVWTQIRENTGFDTVPVNLTVVILFFLLLWLALPEDLRKKRWAIPVALGIFAALAYAMILPFVSNGEADLAKHMFLFIEIIDLMLLFVLLRALEQPKQAISLAVLCAVMLTVCFPHTGSPDTIQFGGQEWYIIDQTDDTQTLLCTDAVTTMPYDLDDRNFYAESDLRTWLNGPFLETFSPEERERIVPQDHKVLHSVTDKASATVGFRDFFCISYPTLASANYDDAYGSICTDLVTVPSIELITELAQQDFPILLDQDYWLETPYFNNGVQVRFLGDDGMIYFANASTALAVRPVICITK